MTAATPGQPTEPTITEEELTAALALDPESHDDAELIVKLWPRLLAALRAARAERRRLGSSERDEWLMRYQHALKALDKCDQQVKGAEAREQALREALRVALLPEFQRC